MTARAPKKAPPARRAVAVKIAAALVVVADPGVSVGPFRVLMRTDGAYLVIDERLPPGLRTVEVFSFVTHDDPKESAIAGCKARAAAEGIAA